MTRTERTIRKVKRFLKTNRLTRRPVVFWQNSAIRMQYRMNNHPRALRFPTAINIETTNHCNEECWFCPRADATRGFGFVSMDLVKKIVDEGVPYGPITYFLHKDGEPLMHPQILEIIRYIKSAHPKNMIHLTTNGVLMKESIARRLIELKVDIVRVGIRAATEETFFKIHKKQHFQRVKDNIYTLLRLRREAASRTPKIITQIVVCDDTKDEIDLFRRTWEPEDVFMEIKDFMTWGGWTSDPTLQVDNTDPRRPPCIDPFHNAVINWDGQVSLCSLDWNCAVKLGDVSKTSLKEMWNDAPVTAVREAHLNGNFHQNSLCANCHEWKFVPTLFWKNRLVFWKDQRWF